MECRKRLMKNYINRFVKFTGICTVKIFICALIGTMLLTLVYMIPVEKIDGNVKNSVVDFQIALYNDRVFTWCHSDLDSFTDSWILMEASYHNEHNSLISAMEVNNGLTDNYNIFRMNVFLEHYLYGKELVKTISYERYWHGNLVLVKLFFYFWNYMDFRIINTVIQMGMMLLICILLFKKKLYNYIIPYLLFVLCLGPATLILSIQYSSCYYILTVGLIAVLLSCEKNVLFVFLYIGISLAYFDFLTYPITTLGIPLTIFLIMNQEHSFQKKVMDSIKMSYCWGIGYGGMWVSKWIIASIILQKNIFVQAWDAVKMRTSLQDEESTITWKGTFLRNFNNFKDTPFCYLVAIFVVVMVVTIIVRFLKNRDKVSIYQMVITAIPFVVVSLLPFLWYAITINHSFIHAFFTYKALAVTVFSLTCMLVKMNERISLLSSSKFSDFGKTVVL